MSESAQTMEQAVKAVAGTAGKHLTFRLANEEYGIAILKVQEIIGMMSVTRVPRTPSFLRGVINLRGKVIPVVDLRLTFGLDARADTERTCIIVMQVARNDARVTMGVIVDEVSEVLDIVAEQLEPAPSFGASIDTDFILGMAKIGQKVFMLLDVDRVLSGQEVGSVVDLAETELPARQASGA